MAASAPLGLADWLSFAASFVFVLFLIAALFFLLKRLTGGRLHLRAGDDRQLSVLESQALGNRQRIVLVRAKDREILLGMSMQQISTLAIWSPEELAKARSASPSGENSMSGVTNASSRSGLMQLLGSLQSRRRL